MKRKLKKWLSIFLIAALVISVQQPGIKAFAEENQEDTISEEIEEEVSEEDEKLIQDTELEKKAIQEEKTSLKEETDLKKETDPEKETEQKEETEQEKETVQEEETEQKEETIQKEETEQKKETVQEEETEQKEEIVQEEEIVLDNSIKNQEMLDEVQITTTGLESEMELQEEDAQELEAYAADIASGTDGNITWVIGADGKLTLNGSGDFTRSSDGDYSGLVCPPWYSYRNEIRSAEVSVSGMTDASYMFLRCENLESLDLDNFDTSNVVSMEHMFDWCMSLENLSLNNFQTGNVETMSYMFHMCNGLTNLDLSNFDTNKVVNMRGMFASCNDLVSLNLSSFDVSNVTDMGDMLNGCYNLIKIYTPINVGKYVALPSGSVDFWRLPDGTKTTILPQNLDHSVMIVPHRNPKIITTTDHLNTYNFKDAWIKYVPYSYTIKTDNKEDDNKVTYSIIKGGLARGLHLYPETGEIYGAPLEIGEFPITIKAEFSNQEYVPAYADLVLTVLDNTEYNILNASDIGYRVDEYIGTEMIVPSTACDIYYAVTEITDHLFVSQGPYDEFIDLWLNGERLIEGEDYTKERGSTRITVRRQTFENKTNKNGTNTIAAEFRVGGDPSNALKRTAQNFDMGLRRGRGGSGHSRDNGSDGGSAVVPTAMTIVRLVDVDGRPMAGTTLELHSDPQVTQTDQKGTAVFVGIPAGLHTLYVKNGAGGITASRSFELLFGEKASISGDQITVKAGSAFTLQVQVKENELTILSVQEGDVYRVASAPTGDDMQPGMWFFMLLLSAGLGYWLYVSYRRKRM